LAASEVQEQCGDLSLLRDVSCDFVLLSFFFLLDIELYIEIKGWISGLKIAYLIMWQLMFFNIFILKIIFFIF